MRSANEHSFRLPAWGLSLALHGGVVWLAILFTAQVKPALMEEVFKWDVALVETVKTNSPSQPTPQPEGKPTQPAVRAVQPQARQTPSPVEPPPDAVMHRVAPQQTVQMVHPETRPAKPIEQRQEPPPPPKTEPLPPPVTPALEKPIEPVEQHVAEIPKTRPESVMPTKEPEPVQSSEPVIAEHKPVAPPPTEAVEARPVEAPAPPASSLASSSQAEPPPAASSPAAPAHEAPMQTAKAAPGPASQEVSMQTAKAGAPGPEVKTDHRWLAESLWRRVAELKRYPSSARLNGQEGKVVLKAVIRSDGHLIEVTVQKSSGHQILDAAAVEAVKLACPLHMKHAINKPEIVVSLPIVYTLAN